MNPKLLSLGPVFPNMNLPPGGKKGSFEGDGFACELINRIRSPGTAPERSANRPAPDGQDKLDQSMLQWGMLPQWLPVSLPSSDNTPPGPITPQADAPIQGSRPAEPRLVAHPSEDRPATRALRETRSGWTALPLDHVSSPVEVTRSEKSHQSTFQGETQTETPPVSESCTEAPSDPHGQRALAEHDIVQQGSADASEIRGDEALVVEPNDDSTHRTQPPARTSAPSASVGLEEMLPPSMERDHVRIHLDKQLSIEMTTRGQHVEVTLSGTAAAITPLKDIGPELGASLEQGGYSLDGFEAREEGEQPSPREQQPKDEEPIRPARPRGHEQRLQARSGRYA